MKASITPGKRGQFDVLLDDELLFSKQDKGRFPEEAEILGLLRYEARSARPS